MKSKEEILIEQCGTAKFRFYDSEVVERTQYDVLDAMEEYGKLMYNQALEEVLATIRLKHSYGYGAADKPDSVDIKFTDKFTTESSGHGERYYDIITIDQDSIFKLRK